MSFTEIQCVVVSCDLCGDAFGPGDYLVPYDNEGEAKETLGEYGWTVDGTDVWCDNCCPLCTCGHLFAAHEFGDGACEDASCRGCENWELKKEDRS